MLLIFPHPVVEACPCFRQVHLLMLNALFPFVPLKRPAEGKEMKINLLC